MLHPFSTLIKRRNLSCLLTVVLLTIGLTTFGSIQNAQAADPSIQIDKEFASNSVAAGDTGSFTLVVVNDGDEDVTNVEIEDSVDSRLIVTGVSGTLGVYADNDNNAQTVEWLIATLGKGQSATITVDFTVGSSVSADTVDNFSEATATTLGGSTIIRSDGDSIDILEANRPPDCSSVSPSINMLWPPNKKFASVNVLGVTDPDGDPVTITITSIFQDEPVGKRPDGMGIGTSTAQVRSQRDGKDNGRVYEISFTAEDGQGGACTGAVYVSVPLDPSGLPAIDDGALYDSTLAE